VLDGTLQHEDTKELWHAMQIKYPDLGRLLKNAAFSAQPGGIVRSGRLQRKLSRCFGEGWVALPHTAGFVDPLFSSGIAFALTGVERIVQMLSAHKAFDRRLYEGLTEYEVALRRELGLLDLLIAGCYKAMPHFPLFNAWSMLYFAFTLAHEKRRLQHKPVGCLLEADNPEIQRIAQTSYEKLRSITAQKTISPQDINRFTETIRKRILPYNTAGLLDPSHRHMYRHTATE
jgi:FADH2 O2-dependent halogenase